jgi:spore coat protein CotH
MTAGSTTTFVYANADEGAFPQDRVLRVEITMPKGAWETAIQTAESETYARVAVRIDGQDLGDVGFRFKGSYSLKSCVDDQGALTCEKLSPKLRFTEYDVDKRFYALKCLNLNALLNESNLARERLRYRLYRDRGIITPRTSYAVVTVNGKNEGLFHVVEDIDGRFTDDRFAKGNRDGIPYKEAWPDHTDDAYYNYHLATSSCTRSSLHPNSGCSLGI